MEGFLIINKPEGPTSHDIVNLVRRLTGIRRVGHAGTLDPFASGLLVVGVGRTATREFPRLTGLDKRYRTIFRLGATSTTDDRTGNISPSHAANGAWPTQNEITAALRKFVGKIEQVPPMYSAKKINGEKLYELARRGETVERKAVPLEIYELNAVSYEPPVLELDIHCSSGTYIRALARDLGEELESGAYVEELERTAVGPFNMSEAVAAKDLTKDNWEKYIKPPEETLGRCQGTPVVLG